MRKFIALFAALALGGCSDQRPTDPGAVFRPGSSLISHTSPFFTFMSPIVPAPATGAFHSYAAPRLDICRVEQGGCVPVAYATLVDYSGTTGPISLVRNDELYRTTWADLRVLPRGTYRLTVSARPLNSPGPLRHLGSEDVILGDGEGNGAYPLRVEGNTLTIRFRIFAGAFCETSACAEFAVDNATGGQFRLEPTNAAGTFGMDFQPGFMCGANQTNCAAGRVIVRLERYRGPDRCIPVTYDAIQTESCVTIRVEPYGVMVSGVTVGICVEPWADTYANTGHLRFLKVRESSTGVIVPSDVVDLDAVVGQSFFFDCNDEFIPTLNPGAMGRSAEGGRLGGLAALAGHALRPLARLLGPSPLHARRGRGPVIASLEDFSRIGPVLPVSHEFDRDNATGFPNMPLPASASPRARVLTSTIPGSSYNTTGVRGVGGVRVQFTPAGASTQTVLTDNGGYAVASWTLGPVSSNPQTLYAAILYPVPALQNGDFPNPTVPWATRTFVANAAPLFRVRFLPPLGTGSASALNVRDVTPTLRACGPLANGATAAPGQSCDPARTLVLPAPELSKKEDYWSTAWKTNKNTVNNSLYRIDVLVDGYSTGSFLLRRGGGGGSDPAGTYQFQSGSNLPIKFIMVR